MKKLLSIFLSLAMMFCFAACGENGSTDTTIIEEQTVVSEADLIPDTMTSSNGKYEVAFVADIGLLKDKSYNQGTYDGVKLYASHEGLSYKYYQPANGTSATDDDRHDAMKAACDGGAKVVVVAGNAQANALKTAASENPDVYFIFIDGWDLELDNVASIAFSEEQSGFFAGYAIVMEGFEKLGFSGGGGGTNSSCCRFGYGFAQGVSAAAKKLGKKVELNYSWLYGASFSPSPDLQTMLDGWYSNGTEIIFACGGPMFISVAAAASANDAYIVGVDVDQSYESSTVITSAIKEIGQAAMWGISQVYDGTWSDIGNECVILGVADNAVGLPTSTWSFKNFSLDEYEKLKAAVASGEIIVDDDYTKLGSNENLNLYIIK